MTAGDVKARARALLNDRETPYRWGDEAHLAALADALARLETLAPHTRYGADGLLRAGEIDLTDGDSAELPLDPAWREPLALWCAAALYRLDDPDTNNASLSQEYLSRAEAMMRGG